MTKLIRENWGKVILCVGAAALSYWQSDSFWIVAFIYGLVIWFLATKKLPEKVRLGISITIWSAFVIIFGLGYYVNHYMPHGPMIDTGDVVCQNDDRGPCGEKYIEDTRDLNIPSWAKFLRESGTISLFGLAFAGICAGKKNNERE